MSTESYHVGCYMHEVSHVQDVLCESGVCLRDIVSSLFFSFVFSFVFSVVSA